MKILLVILAAMAVAFVPFTPFRKINRLAFRIVNALFPLPIKATEIGGAPVTGMRLYGVWLSLGEEGRIESRELRILFRLWDVFKLRRPAISPLLFLEPRIFLERDAGRAPKRAFLPLTLIERAVGFLFLNVVGLTVIKATRGEMLVATPSGDLSVTDIEAEIFYRWKRLRIGHVMCRLGDGQVAIKALNRGVGDDVSILMRGLEIDRLRPLLKLPKGLFGRVDVEGEALDVAGQGSMKGKIHGAALTLEGEPITDFQADLRFVGTVMRFENASGHLGDNRVTGTIVNDVETDVTQLKLVGSSQKWGARSILKILKMEPFIESCASNLDVDLEGNLDRFETIGARFGGRLEDIQFDLSALSRNGRTSVPSPGRIRQGEFKMELKNGSLEIARCRIEHDGILTDCVGSVGMGYSREKEKVTESRFDLDVRLHARDAADVLELFGWKLAGLSGWCEARCDLKVHLKDGELLDLDAGFEASMEGGRLEGSGLPVLKALGQGGRISFDRMTCRGRARKEGLDVEEFSLHNRWIVLELAGFVPRSGEMRLDGLLRFSAGDAPAALPSFLRASASLIGRFARAGFEVRGDRKDPRVRWKIL